MYLLTVWLTSTIMMVGSFWYCYQILKEKVTPPPATFIILSVTFPLGFYMYAQQPGWGFTANIGLTTAIASTWLVSFVLITKLLIQNKLRVEINSFQRGVIGVSILVVIFWFITKNHFTAYVLLQISMLIGYIPVWQKLWKATKNTDSFVFWGSLFLAALVASYAAYEKNDIQSWIYIIRAAPSMLVVIILMIRVELKQKPR